MGNIFDIGNFLNNKGLKNNSGKAVCQKLGTGWTVFRFQ